MFLPGLVLFRVIHNVTVETKPFLGVSSMREGIYSDGKMNKQTRVFNFQCFSLCYSITPFWNF